MSGYSADWLDRAADSRLEEARREQDREWDDHIRARDERQTDRFRDRAGMGESRRDDKPVKAQRLHGTALLRVRREALGRDDYRCVICNQSAMSLHHVVRRADGDDIAANLASLCGSGTTGCHGDIEHHRYEARERMREWIDATPAVLAYVLERKSQAWLDTRYPRKRAA